MTYLLRRKSSAIQKILFLIIVLLSSTGCNRPVKVTDDAELENISRLWSRYLHEGKPDSLVALTRPYYQRVRNHSRKAETLAALYMAEAYTILENADSAKFFLNTVKPYLKNIKDSWVEILYNTVNGALLLKYDLDYPASLKAYHDAYKISKATDNVRGMISTLSNIVYIYYVLKDPHGIQYATEAMNIVKQLPVKDSIAQVQAEIAMALMQVTNQKTNDALRSLDKADKLANSLKLNQIQTLAYTVRGDIYTTDRKYDLAEKAYEKALRYKIFSEPSFGVMTLLKYGLEKEKRHEFHDADSLYREALDLSMRYNNLEFRDDVLLALAKLHMKMENRQESLNYFNRYHNHIDSLHKTRMVQDFNNIILLNHNLEKQTEVQKYKIENLHNQRLVTLSLSLLSVCLVIIIVMVIFYRKRRHLHNVQVRLLMEKMKEGPVETHPKTMPETGLPGTVIEDKALEHLFERINQKVKEERGYRSRNLSLESLANELDSNRTYVSTAVNTFAGVSFPKYVNKMRIAEAMELLSDPDSDILIKQLADDIGFSSDSSFSKIFKKETGMSPKEFRQSAIYISKESE